MAHFANKIKTVYYEDSTYSTVCIEYEDDFGQLRTHSIPTDPTNSDYKFLIENEGYTEEMLARATEGYKRNSSKAMNLMIRKAAEELANEAIEARVAHKVKQLDERLKAVSDQEDKIKTKVNRKVAELDERLRTADLERDQLLKQAAIEVDNALWDALLQSNDDKDLVFKFKLWALEQEPLQNADRDQKKEFRKQLTLFDCIAYMNTLINN